MNHKVSVIIPAYNAEKYIDETIRSVTAQSYKDYEVIVIDDGSTDNTSKLLNNYDGVVKAITKPNGGPASARNAGIAGSTGKYIAFLDCDDLWAEDKLEKQVDYLDRHPEIGLLFSEAYMFVDEGGERKLRNKIGYTVNPTFCSLLYGDYIPNSTVMIRRGCVDAVGGLNESRSLIAVEDYEYWMRIAKIFPMAGIPKPLAYYRIRTGNLMGDGSDIDKGLRLAITAIEEIERQYPGMWYECGIDRGQLFARLHIRAGFALKQKGEWMECLKKYLKALSISTDPKIFRWIAAATILRRWS